MFELNLQPGKLCLATLRRVSREPVHVSLDPAALAGIHASAAVVTKVIEQNRVVYGINTGFGLLANTRIPVEQLDELQRSIVLSHAAGIGEYMDDATVRLMMVLKVNSLARGFSGIRLTVLEALMTLINAEVYPVVPKKGSVGASGDLAPLAHMSCLLIGEGKARHKGELIDAATALKIAGLEPIALAPKEGLALLNGTQASTAFALEGLFHAEDLYAGAITIGAMSVEAALGSRRPFDARIHEVRGQRGQIDAAACYRHLLVDGSEIGMSHHNCEKVQDPYSLRCQPQVMGACLTQIRQAAEVLVCEANAVSDNPLVFAEDEEIISGGNFHGEPMALPFDFLGIGLAEIANISERRLERLLNNSLSGFPSFLVKHSGLNSGFMITQYAAAALVSENKVLAHPASVDSIPSCENQEDLVSMGTHAGRKAGEIADNVSRVIATEILAACQALDLRTEGLQLGVGTKAAYDAVRKSNQFIDYDKDIEMYKELEKITAIVKDGTLLAAVEAAVNLSV